MVRAGDKVDGTSSSDHVELTISDQPPPLHNKDTSRDNIQNISWMFEMSMEVIWQLRGLLPGSSRLPHPGRFGGKALRYRTCVL